MAISDAPVPPSAIAMSVTPLIDPPVMVTLSTDWVAIEPKPSELRASVSFSTVHLRPLDTIILPSELAQLDGVTDRIQTQLNAKQGASDDLTDISDLAHSDGNIIVSNGLR